MKNALYVLAFLAFLAPELGHSQNKIPIFVGATIAQGDSVGRALTFEIKEAIRGSHGFRLEESATNWPFVRFTIVTTTSDRGLNTAAAYSFTFDDTDIPLNGAQLSVSVAICGADRVRSCARDALASVDSAIELLATLRPNLHAKLRLAAH